ncbi:MAG: DUF5711 family protein [Lachnospiraceae bacterium]
MDNIKKQGFHTVNTNVDELDEKIKKHRRKIFFRTLLVVLLLLIVSGGVFGYFYFKTYTDYRVVSEIEKTDNSGTKYVEYGDGVISYNHDGAAYYQLNGTMIWNQAFEMQNPRIDICEGYAAIYDESGEYIYIMNQNGKQGVIETNKIIRKASVANQGTVAVLTRMEKGNYLDLYAKDGTSLASGTLRAGNSGNPIAISLSNNANKLAVSMIDIEQGQVNSSVIFYNFGAVGQNEIDNIVGSYQYSDTLIPQLDFVTNDKLLAFGDDKILIFEGTQKPEVTRMIELVNQVDSVFVSDRAFGLITEGSTTQNAKLLQVYDLNGNLDLEKEFGMDYSSVSFLDGGQVCIKSDLECMIFSRGGIEKFHFNFEEEIFYIFSDRWGFQYTFVFTDKIQKIRLS